MQSRRLKTGALGTTFGGGPMACAAIETRASRPSSRRTCSRTCARVGAYIRSTCVVGPGDGDQGAGFLLGLRTARPAKDVQAELLERDILDRHERATRTSLRLLPPFILQERARRTLLRRRAAEDR